MHFFCSSSIEEDKEYLILEALGYIHDNIIYSGYCTPNAANQSMLDDEISDIDLNGMFRNSAVKFLVNYI